MVKEQEDWGKDLRNKVVTCCRQDPGGILLPSNAENYLAFKVIKELKVGTFGYNIFDYINFFMLMA